MKLMNEYAKEIPHYDDIPKSVLAAIAFSFALQLEEEDFERAAKLLIHEWATLNYGGIVPQDVPANLRKLIPDSSYDPGDDDKYLAHVGLR